MRNGRLRSEPPPATTFRKPVTPPSRVARTSMKKLKSDSSMKIPDKGQAIF
jgi:hypothetical protein